MSTRTRGLFILYMGSFLLWAAITDRSPISTISDVFNNRPVPPRGGYFGKRAKK